MNKLLNHFKRMQAIAGAYLEPTGQYTDLTGKTFIDNSAEYESMYGFINDIIYMLDGPEQREAQAEAENVGDTYMIDALRTESALTPVMSDDGYWPDMEKSRLLHAAMGLTTEAGEFLDALKKHLFYGKALDETNLKEEIGDLMWYLAIACDALGTDFETEQARNIAKLRARYPEKFSSDKAIERDLTAEREVLE